MASAGLAIDRPAPATHLVRATQRAVQVLVPPVASFVGVSVLVFTAIRLIPGDPIQTLLSTANTANPALVAEFRQEYGLNQPIWVQYFDWVSHIVRGDFGRSLTTGQYVSDIIWPRLAATLLLASVASVIALVAGIGFGVIASYVRGGKGAVLKSVPLVGLAFPSFGIGVALSYLFAVRLQMLPPSGLESPTGTGDIVDILFHTILPAITLSIYPAAFTARLVQGAMDELRGEDFVRTARSLGVKPIRIAIQHVFPNAILPVLTNGAVLIGYMITAAVFIEQVFNWPGVGSMMVNAVLKRDYPVLETGALVVAATYIILNVAVDLLYGLVDPRVNIKRKQIQ